MNRLRESLGQAGVVRLYGVSAGFVNKGWRRWKESKSWDSIQSRSTAPSNVRRKRHFDPEEIKAVRLERP